MKRSGAIFGVAAMLASTTGVGYASGIGLPEVCEAVNNYPELCKEYMEPPLLPELTGSGRVALATELGRLVVDIDPQVTMDRKIDKAMAFSYAKIVKKITLPGIAYVDWEAYEKDEVYYVTNEVDGRDIGIDASTLTFTPLMEETVRDTGDRQPECPTPADSPDYTGCHYVTYVDNGWTSLPGVGADNDDEIGTRLDVIEDMKIADNKCFMQYVVVPTFQEAIGKYGYDFSGPNGLDKAARVMTVGLEERQMANSLNVPVQKILTHIGPNVYTPGQSYSEKIAQNSDTRGNITDKDSSDDWCLLDKNLEEGLSAPIDTLKNIALAAASPAGYDVFSGSFDMNNPDLQPLPAAVLAAYPHEVGNA